MNTYRLLLVVVLAALQCACATRPRVVRETTTIRVRHGQRVVEITQEFDRGGTNPFLRFEHDARLLGGRRDGYPQGENRWGAQDRYRPVPTTYHYDSMGYLVPDYMSSGQHIPRPQ